MSEEQHDFRSPARRLGDIAWRALLGFGEDDCATAAAAIAFYTLFSLPGVMVILATLAGWVFEGEDGALQVYQTIDTIVGPGVAHRVRGLLQDAGSAGQGSMSVTAVGVAGLVIGASGVLVQVQWSLNHAFGVAPHPHRNDFAVLLLKRLLSLAAILMAGTVGLLALIARATLAAFGEPITEQLGSLGALALSSLEGGVVLLVFTGMLALSFRFLPDARLPWSDTFVGALVTSGLLLLGRWSLGLYFSYADPGSAYGAAGSLAVLLVWVYYAAIIYLLGVEFTFAWSTRDGGHVPPDPGAVRVVRQVSYHHPDGTEVERTAP
ncbi:MAG: YihY/virulence factor BrkB family protein [Alphaproteobacteria bacterium]|nr:YihY/virulence factor BrkB family protein [Alphaproteobacteria bacterium]